MSKRNSYAARRPAGVVSIELLLLMPFFAILLYSTYLLGDLMLIQQKTELAARYAAWKHRSINDGDVRSIFFAGQSGRNQVQVIVVKQGLDDRIYPKAEASQAGALRSPPRFLSGTAADLQRPMHIVYEGNTAGGNKATPQSYFGTDQPANQGGGGWTTEQWASVTTQYKAMGYSALSMTLAGAHKVLMGKRYYTEIPPSGMGTIRFRQAAVDIGTISGNGIWGIGQLRDEVNSSSWGFSGLMKELEPQP